MLFGKRTPGETAPAYKSRMSIVKYIFEVVLALRPRLRWNDPWARKTPGTMEQSSAAVRARLKISGRVQGVYYRASAVQQAQFLGLTGWVMNCADGSVEAVAEGPRSKIEELIAWCRQGPAGARVASVEVQWEAAQNAFHGFSVKR